MSVVEPSHHESQRQSSKRICHPNSNPYATAEAVADDVVSVTDIKHQDSAVRKSTAKDFSFAENQPMHEPSFVKEFKECNSVYQIPDKQEPSEISSDGEFRDARNAQILNEDCTEVYLIEKKQEYEKTHGMSMPKALIEEAKREKREGGVRSRRDRGLKHFNKVGYTANDNKPIPRWASDPDLLNEIYRHQTTKPKLAEEIFGKFSPKVQPQVDIIKLLAEYKDFMNSSSWNAHQADLV